MSTVTTPHARGAIDLGDDPVATLVGVLRDLSAELEGLVDRVSILESRLEEPLLTA